MNECVKSPFRWVGSKRRLLTTLVPRLEAMLARSAKGRYIEPFLGGGSVALALPPGPKILSDACWPLMNAWHWLARSPEATVRQLDQLVAQGVDQAAYSRVREQFIVERSHVNRAAQFIYLNHVCFNGVYRENASGRFNVPYGKRKSPQFPTLERLQVIAARLRGAQLLCNDVHVTLDRVRPGDTLYADPPYFKTFSTYLKGGFGAEEHRTLAEKLRDLADQGVNVLISNSDTPEVRALYDWATIESVTESRSVAASGKSREAVSCLLISKEAS